MLALCQDCLAVLDLDPEVVQKADEEKVDGNALCHCGGDVCQCGPCQHQAETILFPASGEGKPGKFYSKVSA